LLVTLERWSVALARRTAVVAIGGMLVLAILISADVLLRFFFKSPIRGLDEAAALLMAVIVAATFPVAIAERKHITIDLLEAALGPRHAKVGETIGAVLQLGFMALLAWCFYSYALRLTMRGDVTMIVGIRSGPFWWAVTAAFALCALLQIVVVARVFTELRAIVAPPRRAAVAIVVACVLATVLTYAAMLGWGKGMAPSALALLALAALWVPLMILVPLGPAMCFAGLVGTAVIVGWPASLNTVAIQTASFMGNMNVSVLPLFLMMGSFAAVAGVSDDVYALAHALLGRWRGGTAMATIGGCAGFGAVTGSSVATVATIGRVAIPEMKARGYHPALATGTVAAGGTLGALVPPGSGPLVVFALLTESSIGQLFVASVGPAVLAVLLYLATIWLYVRLRPGSAPGTLARQPGELRAALKRCGPVAFLFGAVLGGLYFGVFTASESAAVGAAGAFVVALWRGKLRRETFLEVISETTVTTAVIYSIIIGALVFSYFTGLSGLARDVTAWITSLGWPPFAVIVLLLAIYLVLGTFMESYTIMIVSVPIVAPLITGMDLNLLWWGILMLCVVETGAITPPFGLNMFVAKNLADVPMSVVFQGVTPFVIADVIRIAIIAAFPPLSLWLVSMMYR
jgi:C4-dicarboxylate transporter, DctM subunit